MLRLDAELNKDTISKLKKPLGKLYPHFEDAIEEITGHMVKGLDFEKGKALDLGIDDDAGLESEHPYWVWEDGLENGYTPDVNNYSIYYPWSGLENDNSLKDIYIDIKNLYKETETNKLYTW